MAGKMVSCIAVHAALVTFLLVYTFVIADDNTLVPRDSSQISNWFQNNVKPFQQRKGSLESELVQAEEGVKIIKVNINGGGDFTTITDAIKSIPARNTKRVIVHIGHGVYKEKIKIERTQPFVTLHGNPQSMATLTYDGTAAKYGTVDSASLIVESNYFVAANLIFQVHIYICASTNSFIFIFFVFYLNFMCARICFYTCLCTIFHINIHN